MSFFLSFPSWSYSRVTCPSRGVKKPTNEKFILISINPSFLYDEIVVFFVKWEFVVCYTIVVGQ